MSRWRDLWFLFLSGAGLGIMNIGQALHYWAEDRLPAAKRLPPLVLGGEHVQR